MVRKVFLDVETCGLHGVPVIIQYAFDDGPINIHNFWSKPICESLALIEDLMTCEVIGFNLAFDHFHVSKIYTLLDMAKDTLGLDAFPDEHITTIAKMEESARNGRCVKPFKSFDLMLHARKTEFQVTMERSDIRIRRVPTALAWSLAKVLEQQIIFDPILFARRKKHLAPRWTVIDISRDGQVVKDFKDIVLKFKPSIALKALAIHVLNIPYTEILTYGDVEVNKVWWPAEVGYAPFAAAVDRMSKKQRKALKKKHTWPKVIEHHIRHWDYHEKARLYASKDVEYTRRLYEHFGCPTTGDDDSELATMVGAVRWRGYAIDLEGMGALKAAATARIKQVPTSPRYVKRWISEVLSEEEKATFTSTGKVILEKMAAQRNGSTCPFGPCEHCNNTGMLPAPESAKRAFDVLEARKMIKEIELYDKLLLARRFHASFKVIGALSGRMAGADKLNAQGIKRTKEVRSQFPLAFGKLVLRGGDFSAFEVVLADAAYNDSALRRDLLTCERCRDVQVEQVLTPMLAKEFLSEEVFKIYINRKLAEEDARARKSQQANKAYERKSEHTIRNGIVKTFACPKCGDNQRMKIHALFGIHVYPDMDYDQIKATSGTADDRYNKAKSAVFAMIYGGMAFTLMTRLGVPIEIAEEAYQKFLRKYPGIAIARQKIIDAFCTMRQTGGIGSMIEWHDPAEFIESLLGFKRYFILENKITAELFKLAEKPPKEWLDLKVKVRRRDRDQTASGAVRSALFGTAFQIQAGNLRAACNHEIQSSGAQITKHVQRKIWDVQPSGINDWLVQPMNVHDEILCPLDPSVENEVEEVVFNAVESFRSLVPLIEFDWHAMSNWAEK